MFGGWIESNYARSGNKEGAPVHDAIAFVHKRDPVKKTENTLHDILSLGEHGNIPKSRDSRPVTLPSAPSTLF